MNPDDFDAIPVGLFAIDHSQKVVMWNLCIADWTGLQVADALGSHLSDVFPQFGSPAYQARITPLFAGAPPVMFSPHLHARLYEMASDPESAMSRRHLQTSVSATTLDDVPVALFAVQDMTAELERGRLLRERSEEREQLLREHHHRIKNNLGMLASLLELQKDALYDPRDEEVMDVFVSRVLSIQRVHQHLYAQNSGFNLPLSEYIDDFVRDAVATNTSRVAPEVRTNVVQVELSMSQAIPVGMILAELITNSFKYGFGDAQGWISIDGSCPEGTDVVLEYQDSGDGSPDEIQGSGLGSELNEAFADQLGGSICVAPGPGQRTTLTFPLATK